MIAAFTTEMLTAALSLAAVGVAMYVMRGIRAARSRDDVAELVLESAWMECVDRREARAILTLRHLGPADARDVRVDHRLGAGPCALRVTPAALAIPAGGTGVYALRVDVDRLALSVAVGDCQQSVDRWCASGAEIDVDHLDRRGARQYATLRLPERGTLHGGPASRAEAVAAA